MKKWLRILVAFSFATLPILAQGQDLTSVLPTNGSTPEYTSMLTYLATFKESSFTGNETPSLQSFLAFLKGEESESTITTSRLLSSQGIPEFEAERFFAVLFRLFSPASSVTTTSLSSSSREANFSGFALLGGGQLVRGEAEEPNPVFDFFLSALQPSFNTNQSDPKLQDPRYTLD